MRRLIRPTLFMVVRLGLFLSVTAWIAGRNLYLQWLLPKLILIGIHGGGWYVVFDYESDLSPFEFQEQFEDGYRILDYPGVQIVDDWSRRQVTLSHWLIVSTLIVFYAVLEFIYRRKPEAQPCED